MDDQNDSEKVPSYRPDNIYDDVDLKFEELALAEAKRLRGFFIKALFAFAVLGMTSAGALLGFGIVLNKQRETSRIIQKQRYNSIYENCIQQNYRHSNTVKKAKRILPVDSQKAVILLVNELQPYVDNCVMQAKNRVQGKRDAK